MVVESKAMEVELPEQLLAMTASLAMQTGDGGVPGGGLSDGIAG